MQNTGTIITREHISRRIAILEFGINELTKPCLVTVKIQRRIENML
jgi:hypothetical protein